MKILWVKADKLLPVRNGGNIRTYHILRYLAARHDVTFLTYYGGTRDSNYESAIERELPGALSICTGKKELSGLRRGLDYVERLRSDAPYAVSRFADDQVRRPIQAGFQEKRFDVAVCDFLDAAVNFPERIEIPTVLFQHNVESEIWRRHAETAKDPVRKAIYGMEFRKMLSYERSALHRFQHVIAVSESDRSLMSRWVDPSRITVVPTGVDLSHYAPASEAKEKGQVVTFVGAMDWEPNVDGVEFFCSEIWPEIRKAVPEAKFRIVGRNPGRRVQRWASEAIEVTGEVPSVLEYLHEASVVVVPLRIGGGTRLKIYEAMAAGKAVVSTTVGAEGLDVEHARDIILADGAGPFAEAVITLLRDESTRQRYGKAAAETAARYDWSAIGHRFEEVLQLLAAGSKVGEAGPARSV